MNGTHRGTTRAFAALVMMIFGLGSIVVGVTTASAAGPGGERIAFCHYAGSNDHGGSGTWISIETSVGAFYNAGHVNHSNDVYPAGSFDPPSPKVPVQSWSAQGDQSFISNGCESDEPETETQTQPRTVEGDPDCEAGTVATQAQERSRTKTDGVWGEWSEWSDVGAPTTRPLSEEEAQACAEVLGNDAKSRTVEGEPDCDAGTVPVMVQKSDGTEVSAGVWEWSEWRTISESTRPVTKKECPGTPGEPNTPEIKGGGGVPEPEVLGIEAKAPAAAAPAAAAPAGAPTAIDAGLTVAGSGSSNSPMLWILAGTAFMLAGLVLGFGPAPARGKRAL